VRLGVDRQPERRLGAIEQPVAGFERQGLKCRLAAIVEPGGAGDVVIGGRRGCFEAQVVGRDELEAQHGRQRGIGAGALAEAAAQFALDFLVADLADVGADVESEQMLGVDLGTLGPRLLGARHRSRPQQDEERRRREEIPPSHGRSYSEGFRMPRSHRGGGDACQGSPST
jgi:hypothetical protein